MANDLASVGGGYTAEQIDLIKTQICKGATDGELKMFLMVCQRSGLDPFARQIHAVKRWNSKTQREDLSIQTGIDGFRLIAERTGKYAGNDDPVYDSENSPRPNKATVTVWKIVSGQRVPFTRSARWAEFVQTTKDGTPTKFWAKMPYLMLGKVAEALALRAAFPQELSGLYTSEEMGQADSDVEVAPSPPRPHALPPRQQQRQPEPAVVEPEPLDEPFEPEPAPPAKSQVDVPTILKALASCQSVVELEATLGAAALHRQHGRIVDGDWADVAGTAADAVAKFVAGCKTEEQVKAVADVYKRGVVKHVGTPLHQSVVIPEFTKKKSEFEAAKAANADPFAN